MSKDIARQVLQSIISSADKGSTAKLKKKKASKQDGQSNVIKPSGPNTQNVDPPDRIIEDDGGGDSAYFESGKIIDHDGTKRQAEVINMKPIGKKMSNGVEQSAVAQSTNLKRSTGGELDINAGDKQLHRSRPQRDAGNEEEEEQDGEYSVQR